MKVGMDIMINKPENTIRGPYLSINAPTIMRAGIVNATLQIANILRCSAVSQLTSLSIVVAKGAILNHT